MIPENPPEAAEELLVRTSDGFVLRVTQPFEVALQAFRLARLADSASVPDQLVGEQYPFFLRDDLDQVLLDLLGSMFFDKSRRPLSRCTCVSTTTPDGMPNAVPSTTFAVFRATPGRVRSSGIVFWHLAAKFLDDSFC